MTDDERRQVDGACLLLLGFKQHQSLPDLWFGDWRDATVGNDGPSQDESFVVPLAEALRKRGWRVQISCGIENWFVEIRKQRPQVIRILAVTEAESMHEALAIAAARAVRKED